MAGPEFIRPDPSLGGRQSSTATRIANSINKLGTFFQHVENRRFDQARLQLARENLIQQGELGRQRIEINKLTIDHKIEAEKSDNKREVLNLARSGDLNDMRNQMLNDPTLINTESLGKMASDASLLLNSKQHSGQAADTIEWVTQQQALQTDNEFKGQISEYNSLVQVGKAAETREELDPRKKIGSIIRGGDETNRAIYGFKELDEWTPAAIANAKAKLERAAIAGSRVVEVIPAPAGDVADAGADLGLTPTIDPIQAAVTEAQNVNDLLGDPDFMEIMATDAPLRDRFEELGGDTGSFREVRVGDKSVFVQGNVAWGFDKAGNFMQANQIPSADRAAEAPPKIIPGNTFQHGPGLQFDSTGVAHIKTPDGGTMTVGRTNIPGQAKVLNTFHPSSRGVLGGLDINSILGPEGAGTSTQTQPVGVPPVQTVQPPPVSTVGAPRVINVSFSNGNLVTE